MSDLISKLENLIRTGAGAEAKNIIEDLSNKERKAVPVFLLAAFYRRTNDPLTGCRHIFSMLQTKHADDPRLMAEYGICLADVGCFTEATKILEAISPEVVPQTLFYQALKDFRHWHYHDGLRKLRQYVELESDDYRRTIGKLNMISSHMSREEYEQADTLIAEVEPFARKNSYKLMLGNVMEQKAYVAYMFRKNQNEALQILNESLKLLQRSETRGFLYAAKWKLVFHLREGRNRSELKSEIESFQKQAREMQDWESLRDMDRQLAVQSEDDELFNRVYFGTPYLAFRERLKKMWPGQVIPEMYTYRLGKSHEKTFNVLSGCIEDKSVLPKNSLRLLQTLMSDFYSRLNVGAVHERLYLQEHFNPFSGPLRVHQAVLRLRKHLSEKRLGVEVLNESGVYGWTLADESLGLTVPREMLEPSIKKMNPRLAKLKLIVGENSFSIDEAVAALEASKRTVYRLVSEGGEAGFLREDGRSRFRFVA